MTSTCVCRMQSFISKKMGKNVIYLSPMHLSQRAIIGYDIPDSDPKLVGLDKLKQLEVRGHLVGENKFRKGQYILKAMRKLRGNGCILFAHQFG